MTISNHNMNVIAKPTGGTAISPSSYPLRRVSQLARNEKEGAASTGRTISIQIDAAQIIIAAP